MHAYRRLVSSELENQGVLNSYIEFKKRICSDLANACGSVQHWVDYSESDLRHFGFEPNEKQVYQDEYWNTHLEEKVVIKSEKKSLTDGIPKFNDEIAQISKNTEKDNIQERIKKLVSDKIHWEYLKEKKRKLFKIKLMY